MSKPRAATADATSMANNKHKYDTIGSNDNSINDNVCYDANDDDGY